MLNFPNAPADGEISAQPNGVKYQWNDTLSRWDSLSGKLPAVAGTVVQKQTFETGEFSEGTNLIPGDDTIPQISEGSLAMTLAFTPKYATSELLIEVSAMIAYTPAFAQQTVALFRDSEANALACNSNLNSNSNAGGSTSFLHRTPAGSTQTQTFTVRHGGNIGGTSQFNGWSNGRKFGGASSSSITITEIQPNAVVPEPYDPSIAQIIDAQSNLPLANNASIPSDDTIPQITEGFLQSSQVFVPTQVGAIVEISVNVQINTGTSQIMMAALFVDSQTDALASRFKRIFSGNEWEIISFTWVGTMTDLASRTFSVRCGAQGNTMNVNADSSGNRQHGGVINSGMIIKEIIPTAPQSIQSLVPPFIMGFTISNTGTVTKDNGVGLVTGSDGGTGIVDVTFVTPQDDNEYQVVCNGITTTGRMIVITNQTNTGFQIKSFVSGGGAGNNGHDVICLRNGSPWK